MAGLGLRPTGKLILQLANRDTAAAIFLGLATDRAYDPDAAVLTFPPDPFVYPEERFVAIAHSMAGIARHMEEWVYPLGAFPARAEPEHAWIQPRAHLALRDGCCDRRALGIALRQRNDESVSSVRACIALYDALGPLRAP